MNNLSLHSAALNYVKSSSSSEVVSYPREVVKYDFLPETVRVIMSDTYNKLARILRTDVLYQLIDTTLSV